MTSGFVGGNESVRRICWGVKKQCRLCRPKREMLGVERVVADVEILLVNQAIQASSPNLS